MTVKERLEDISRRCGLDEEIIRRVLKAESESILESLKRGERATLIGRCSIVPYLGKKLIIGGMIRNKILVRFQLSTSLQNELDKYNGFVLDGTKKEEEDDGLIIRELTSLL